MVPADEEALPFWFDTARRGATEAEIDQAEEYVGQRLPKAFRDLLLIRNGGVSNYAAYVSGDSYYPLLPILGVDPEAAGGTLMRAMNVAAEFGVPAGVVPFAAQGGAWWGFDYRQGAGTPSIVFRGDEETGIEHVTASFEKLLEGLVEE